MNSIPTQSFPIFSFRSDCENIELSGLDLEVVTRIKEIAQRFTDRLKLSVNQFFLKSTYWGASFSSFCDRFMIPTCCFPKETRDKIDEIFSKNLPFPICEKNLAELEKVALEERDRFLSLEPDELSFIIAHEIGHYWLKENMKAFQSQSVTGEDDQPVATLEHDRAHEQACDLIASYLCSPTVAITALSKMISPSSSTIDNTHPPLEERIGYLKQWQNLEFPSELSKEFLLQVVGPVLREAEAIYKKHGK